MQGLFKSRRAVQFFPKANSSGSGATVLSEPVFSSGQRYGRHSMPVVYLEAEFRGESWPHEPERFTVRDRSRVLRHFSLPRVALWCLSDE